MTVAAWERLRNLPYSFFWHAEVRFNNRAYIIGGIVDKAISNVVISTNNVQAEDQIFINPTGLAQRADHAATVFNEKLWVSGGQGAQTTLNDVVNSPDGKEWATTGYLPERRQGHRMVAFGNEKIQLVVLGGVDEKFTNLHNEIYTSVDGRVWKTVQVHTNIWAARQQFGCLVYKNKLWVFGGLGVNAIQYFNDVWCSDNLTHWTRAVEHAPWQGKGAFAYCVWDERMWIIGGFFSRFDQDREVWYSRDGVTWKQSFDFPKDHVYGNYATELDNRLHIFGGQPDMNGLYRMNLG